MNSKLPILYYVHDPMCSWCWGFRSAWQRLQQRLEGRVIVQNLLGGLAADTDQLMSETMQQSIRATWRSIQQEIPSTKFNYDFWAQCRPRRSTYPACRAVIACKMQEPALENAMILAIQQAYYCEAKNPSDDDILIQAAEKIGLDKKSFIEDLNSKQCQLLFNKERELAENLGVYSYPSLVLLQDNKLFTIDIDYTSSDKIYQQIKANIEAFSVR